MPPLFLRISSSAASSARICCSRLTDLPEPLLLTPLPPLALLAAASAGLSSSTASNMWLQGAARWRARCDTQWHQSAEGDETSPTASLWLLVTHFFLWSAPTPPPPHTHTHLYTEPPVLGSVVGVPSLSRCTQAAGRRRSALST